MPSWLRTPCGAPLMETAVTLWASTLPFQCCTGPALGVCGGTGPCLQGLQTQRVLPWGLGRGRGWCLKAVHSLEAGSGEGSDSDSHPLQIKPEQKSSGCAAAEATSMKEEIAHCVQISGKGWGKTESLDFSCPMVQSPNQTN